MNQTPTLRELLPGVFEWAMHSPEHKVELTSHAVVTDGRVFCFDPIPLADEGIKNLETAGKPAAIVLTNENHERSAVAWRERWQVPILASANANLAIPEVARCEDESEWRAWQWHSLAGGAGGETALRLESRSLVVVGDAVVNLPGRQLEILPEKYCRNRGELRESLRRLVARPFDMLLMAHGTPILAGASARVAELLA